MGYLPEWEARDEGWTRKIDGRHVHAMIGWSEEDDYARAEVGEKTMWPGCLMLCPTTTDGECSNDWFMPDFLEESDVTAIQSAYPGVEIDWPKIVPDGSR